MIWAWFQVLFSLSVEFGWSKSVVSFQLSGHSTTEKPPVTPNTTNTGHGDQITHFSGMLGSMGELCNFWDQSGHISLHQRDMISPHVFSRKITIGWICGATSGTWIHVSQQVFAHVGRGWTQIFFCVPRLLFPTESLDTICSFLLILYLFFYLPTASHKSTLISPLQMALLMGTWSYNLTKTAPHVCLQFLEGAIRSPPDTNNRPRHHMLVDLARFQGKMDGCCGLAVVMLDTNGDYHPNWVLIPSMGRFRYNLPTWMVNFYGFHVGKYTSPMDGMGVVNIQKISNGRTHWFHIPKKPEYLS